MNNVVLGFNYDQRKETIKDTIYNHFINQCQQNNDYITLSLDEYYEAYILKTLLVRSRTDFLSLGNNDEIISFIEYKCKDFIDELKNNPLENNIIVDIIPKSIRFIDNIDGFDLTYFTLDIKFLCD